MDWKRRKEARNGGERRKVVGIGGNGGAAEVRETPTSMLPSHAGHLE